MSTYLVSSSYLEETSSKIRSKPVPWEVVYSAVLFLILVNSFYILGIPARWIAKYGGARTDKTR